MKKPFLIHNLKPTSMEKRLFRLRLIPQKINFTIFGQLFQALDFSILPTFDIFDYFRKLAKNIFLWFWYPKAIFGFVSSQIPTLFQNCQQKLSHFTIFKKSHFRSKFSGNFWFAAMNTLYSSSQHVQIYISEFFENFWTTFPNAGFFKKYHAPN